MALIKPARMSGFTLRALAMAARSTPAVGVIAATLREQMGISAMLALGDEGSTALPTSVFARRARPARQRPSPQLELPSRGEWPRTLLCYQAAYHSGQTTPEQVTQRALERARELAALTPSRGPLMTYDEDRALVAARESGDRIRTGNSRGPLEGSVVAIKEEVDVVGLPTRLGTSWLPIRAARADAPVVARLRAAGAVIIGQTPMTEYGFSTLGGNAHRVMPRNAHDPARLPGGSSSGSAVAVATGVTPVALGADGGGSIRVPAALNGVFGLKPTYGRIPLTGDRLVRGSSLGHLGGMGASTRDLAVFTEVTSGPDRDDPASELQPPLPPGELMAALGGGVAGLRIGVDEQQWQAAEPQVAGPAREALAALERDGAQLVPVNLRLAPHAAAIGYVTFGLEAYNALKDARQHLAELGYDVQLMLAGLRTFGPDDYLQAQRLRVTLRQEVAEAFTELDLIALPTTAMAAPSVTDQEARSGFVDPVALNAMCRFAFLANLTGVPAGTAPVGSNGQGLPVGLQLLGDAWDEAVVLQALAHLERIGVARAVRPPVAVDLFSD